LLILIIPLVYWQRRQARDAQAGYA
jgi:hypothetical protein